MQACNCKRDRLWVRVPLDETKSLTSLFPLFGSTNEAKQGVGPHAALYLVIRARNLKLKMLNTKQNKMLYFIEWKLNPQPAAFTVACFCQCATTRLKILYITNKYITNPSTNYSKSTTRILLIESSVY